MNKNVAVLMLTLPVSDIRRIKRVIRTLGALGVYSFDSIIEEMVLGCIRKRDSRRERDIEMRRPSWERQNHLS
jgi:hypothetical protein